MHSAYREVKIIRDGACFYAIRIIGGEWGRFRPLGTVLDFVTMLNQEELKDGLQKSKKWLKIMPDYLE